MRSETELDISSPGKKPMPGVVTPLDQRVVLQNVSWETYERILAEHNSSSVPHFTYDHGELEITSPSSEHETLTSRIEDLVGILAVEMDMEAEGLRSTTFSRKDLERGFEPDSCFYFENVERIRGKDRLDMAIDPPPDLVVEVDVTSPSIGKLAIFAEFGVPEVWRFRGGRMSIFRLTPERKYQEVSGSKVLPGLTSGTLSELLGLSGEFTKTGWLKLARAWAHEHFGK